MFCGAGGTSTGLAQACEEAGLELNLLAINHWDVAVDTHSKNHTSARHICESMDNVDPRKQVPGGRLNLLVASPECTHHSRARGGKPMSDQSRASAWHIVRWAEALYIENILIENVKEFAEWSPLGSNGRPLKSRKGETFQAFIRALESLNYNVEHRVLNAADYGDPTTRQRLFIMARKRPRKVEWPVPSHHQAGAQETLFDQGKPWRTAREVIDWSIPGKSIFNRKKPLAPTTIARIAAGLQKFGGAKAEPFLVVLRNHGGGRSVDQPVPTVTAGGNHIGLCEPFIAELRHGKTANSIDEPLSTVTTKGAHHALVEPFLVEFRGSHASRNDGNRRVKELDQPLPTQDTSNRFALVEPFLVPFFGEREGQTPRCHSVDSPLPAVTSHGAGALVEPFIVPLNHAASDTRSYSLDRPMPTVTSVDAWSVIEPWLVKFYGTGGAQGTDEPLGTITAKDRFGLVQTYGLDIRFRMLQPRELARAMSFPDTYEFAGSREFRVKQIGNAVAVSLAKSLCRSFLTEYQQKRAAA